MKSKKQNFIEWNNNILISSFKKINLNIILIVVLDFLFYFLSGYLIILWLQRIQAKMASFNIPTDVLALGAERAQQLVSEVKGFYYLIVFSFIVLLIAIIFLASILKGVIWAKVTGTKITFKLISKFLGLNLLWMGFWFVIVFFISFLANPASAPILMISAIILGIYFTNTLYTIFMKNQSLKLLLGSIKLNITKFHLFLLPHIMIFLLLYVIIRLSNLLKFKYSTILLGSILIVYAAAVRYYASTLVLEVEKT